MTGTNVVLGAGSVGLALARELSGTGADVLLVSRSGTGPDVPGVRRAAVDVTDGAALEELVRGAEVLHNCLNPPSYVGWERSWPPVAAAVLTAAERSGAVLVTASNLYPYGPVSTPLVEGMPDAATGTKGRVRARLWADARAAHDAGRVRAVEVRASDFMGPDVRSAHIAQVAPKALAGKPVRLFGRVDVPHAMTDVRDLARAMVAVSAVSSAWGRVWHAPTNPARTQAETVADVCRAVGREPVSVVAYPRAMLALGVFVPFLKEMREVEHQFLSAWEVDSTAIARELGLEPTPWDEVCRATAESALVV